MDIDNQTAYVGDSFLLDAQWFDVKRDSVN
jgi:hypothetical protein